MYPRKFVKQNKLKRFILKILGVYAYDKETLNIVNPYYKESYGNIFDFNNINFNFSRGYLNLKRKIKKLDIYYRYSPNNNLWNSTERWKRIVTDINKETLILVCLISLRDSIKNFIDKNSLNVTLNLIADNSNKDFDKKIFNLFQSDKIEIKHFNSKISGNRGSYLECCDQAEKADDLIFFVEDDYLFEKNCIDEMLSTFSKISSLLENDIFICPSDYPFYYDSLYKTSLLVGKSHKWRIVNETLLTFMLSKEIFKKYKKEIRCVGEIINEPFEKPLLEIYKRVNCLAPINTLSYHISRSVPSINEDWEKTWNINFDKFQKFIS